jgi:hypothetical protein
MKSLSSLLPEVVSVQHFIHQLLLLHVSRLLLSIDELKHYNRMTAYNRLEENEHCHSLRLVTNVDNDGEMGL